jgi:hypothetical protein
MVTFLAANEVMSDSVFTGTKLFSGTPQGIYLISAAVLDIQDVMACMTMYKASLYAFKIVYVIIIIQSV